jgi:hypothetical protein
MVPQQVQLMVLDTTPPVQKYKDSTLDPLGTNGLKVSISRQETSTLTPPHIKLHNHSRMCISSRPKHPGSYPRGRPESPQIKWPMTTLDWPARSYKTAQPVPLPRRNRDSSTPLSPIHVDGATRLRLSYQQLL